MPSISAQEFCAVALARQGKKPQGNEEHSCLEASYPSWRVLEPINITTPAVLAAVGPDFPADGRE
jgi:hypothetical protein